MSRLLGVAGLFVLAGCGSTPSAADSGTTVNCQNSPIEPNSTTTVPPYQLGMIALPSTGSVQVKLVQSNPSPPTSDENAWVIQVQDGSGNPISGATVSVPPPFMPLMGHPSDQTPSVEQGSNGQWTVSDLYFFMDGVWRTTVDVTNAGVQNTYNFYVCIDD
jgi:hypothetical protein